MAGDAQRQQRVHREADGIFPSGYYLFRGAAPDSVKAALQSVGREAAKPETRSDEKKTSYRSRLWKGWILPASDADTWFAAGSAAYYRVLQSQDLEKSIDAVRANTRRLKLEAADDATRVRLQESQGVLYLDALRRKLGDDKFFAAMTEFFDANSTKTVTAQAFLDKLGERYEVPDPGSGPVLSGDGHPEAAASRPRYLCTGRFVKPAQIAMPPRCCMRPC